ncbi:MAG TPA: hypothetical protein DDZ97_08695 [Deltaproteobacteria bacterium]|nr:hypothetical protein [Deltaproteobacteria bacterium]
MPAEANMLVPIPNDGAFHQSACKKNISSLQDTSKNVAHNDLILSQLKNDLLPYLLIQELETCIF